MPNGDKLYLVNLQLMQKVIFRDLGKMDYQQAWDYQETLLQENVKVKSELRRLADAALEGELGRAKGVSGGVSGERNAGISFSGSNDGPSARRPVGVSAETVNYFLFVEHPPVYTLGKSGHIENVLINEEEMQEKGMQFFRTNRGGDITFHGPGQIVGYPILDLEKFTTDIGKYLRNLEEVIIQLLALYGIKGERSTGETGVWIEPGVKGRERKICAIGIRCSRWITMHGFALNVNTDLSYFGNIVPCGIQDKQVSSLERELGHPVDIAEAKQLLKQQFERVFGVEMASDL
jgi:lipoyl(octanoyl) transferase